MKQSDEIDSGDALLANMTLRKMPVNSSSGILGQNASYESRARCVKGTQFLSSGHKVASQDS